MVADTPRTTGSIGTPASAYRGVSSRASAQKCGGVHRNTIKNRKTAPRPIRPFAAAQPTSGGIAPAAPPMTMFWAVLRFSQRV